MLALYTSMIYVGPMENSLELAHERKNSRLYGISCMNDEKIIDLAIEMNNRSAKTT